MVFLLLGGPDLDLAELGEPPTGDAEREAVAALRAAEAARHPTGRSSRGSQRRCSGSASGGGVEGEGGAEERPARRGLTDAAAWEAFVEGHVSDATRLHADAMQRIAAVCAPPPRARLCARAHTAPSRARAACRVTRPRPPRATQVYPPEWHYADADDLFDLVWHRCLLCQLTIPSFPPCRFPCCSLSRPLPRRFDSL